jgi:[ribosomal protein S5]-alanine N-acetyltransferase
LMLETERLTLRRFAEDDWLDLYDYLSQEIVVKYEPYGVFDEEECKHEAIRRSQEDAFWAVCLKETKRLTGNIYFKQLEPKAFQTWEIGFVFNAVYQGKGYATEACEKILEYGFKQAAAHRIIGNCNPENTPSWKLMERLQMRREGHFRKPAFFKKSPDGKPLWHDAYQYSIIDEEYLALKSNTIEAGFCKYT